MTRMLTLVRGLPGAGKSTVAGRNAFEADKWFLRETGEYQFDRTQLKVAHQWCQDQVRAALTSGQNATVANTFTQFWEMQPYVDMAEELGFDVKIVDLFDGGLTDLQLAERNTHGVPVEAIQRMRDRYEGAPAAH